MRKSIDGTSKPTRSGRGSQSAVRQASLREHNMSLVLRAILESPQPLTRAQVAGQLGLTRATISSLADTLIEAKFVQELEPVAAKGAGRPGVPLTAMTSHAMAVGIEVQVDQLTVGVSDISGRLLTHQSDAANYRNSDPREVMADAVALATPVIESLQAKGAQVLGVGFSVPGLTRRGGGEVRFAPNLQWHGVDLFELVGTQASWSDLPFFLGNDADVSALAESWARARVRGRPTTSQSFMFLAGEVGIGGAMLIEGKPVEGQHGWSGEIGHMCVDPEGPHCGCGARGCLEQFAGRDAVFRSAGLTMSDDTSALIRALEQGDPKALQAVSMAGRMLGLGLANAINLLDVDRVVLGGFLENLQPYLRRDIEHELYTRVMAARWSPLLVEAGQLGRRAPVVGTARLVLNAVIDNPTPWLATAR